MSITPIKIKEAYETAPDMLGSAPAVYFIAMSMLGNLNGKKVLDVGCGQGYFSILSAKNESVCCGLDLTRGAAKIALKLSQEQRVRDKTNFVCGDAHNLPFRSGYFDVVICTEALEHVLKPRKCVKEFSRVVKMTGSVLLSIPNYLNIRYPYVFIHEKILGKDVRMGKHQLIEQKYTISHIENFLKEANLKISEVRGCYYLAQIRLFLIDLPLAIGGKMLEKLPYMNKMEMRIRTIKDSWFPPKQILNERITDRTPFIGRIFPFKYTGLELFIKATPKSK